MLSGNITPSSQLEIWIVFLSFSSGILSGDTYYRCLEQLDVSSQIRVKRYYRREDAWRSLIGMLLPRILLCERGILLESVKISRTDCGKPFIVGPSEFPAVGYNISHDNKMIAMVSHVSNNADVHLIGIDIMKRSIPQGETVRSFLKAIEETLTQAELSIFTPDLDDKIAMRYIFLLWTMKEAYTKALGMGLGFDFRRIHFNIAQNCVFVDGKPAQGWEFLLFEMQQKGHGEIDLYQGAIARWVGGGETRLESISDVENDPRFHMKELSALIDKCQ